jgi:hypothetical protein
LPQAQSDPSAFKAIECASPAKACSKPLPTRTGRLCWVLEILEVLVPFAPNGYKHTLTLIASAVTAQALNLRAAGASGITLSATFAGHAIGDTWVIPVWSASAKEMRQTGIVSPYSPFQGSANSVGGLKSATFTPKFDGVKLLESGFPEGIDDRMITKTSANVKFEAMEYDGPLLQYLRDMVSQIANEYKTPAISCEVVMRTRGNKMVSFWVPNTGLNTPPSYGPTNDYSTLPWELEAFNQTEVSVSTPGFESVAAGEIATYNAWLRNAWLFNELQYVH